MSTEKRLVLFLILSVATMWGMQFLLGQMGLLPKPPQRAPVAQAPAEAKDAAQDPASKPAEVADAKAKAEAEASPEAPGTAPEASSPEAVPKEPPELMVLGSATDKSPDGYRLQVQLTQRGAGVESVLSSRHEAEIQEGKPRGRPLELVRTEPGTRPSFGLNLARPRPGQPAAAAGEDAAVNPEMVRLPLEDRDWTLLRDEQGRTIRPVRRTDPMTHREHQGQEVVFETTTGEPDPITVRKRYRLFQGEDGFELEIELAGSKGEPVTYELLGPHGLPIEGEWYTAVFRDVFFGGVEPDGGVQIVTRSAYDVARSKDSPERYTALPLKYAGVENQYFAVFAAPVPPPTSRQDSTIKEAQAVVVRDHPRDSQKADVSVELLSKSQSVGPERVARQTFRIFAGPKTYEALEPFGATDLSRYRKGWSLWIFGDLGASFLATYFISPMLQKTYAATAAVARAFGGSRGSYGIAIILLTVLVRLILFPLGRKQAKAAKKMQDLQPYLAELKEKYGDDKERITKETWELYKRHGVNPLGGCLPALIQFPVLIGLWQALNNSVALRHSQFLWIQNLAAPDMLFKFPFTIPLVGQWLGPYFNVLPIVVVILMLVQTKLFSPPPTTPEAEAQQRMMKYMMIFMAFLFYKVPSGLGIYFITSSLWQIGERLLLPKTTAPAPAPVVEASSPTVVRSNRAEREREPGDGKASGWLAEARERARQIIEEASKDRTIRNEDRKPERTKHRPRPGRKR